jgi:multidrug efflux pump subunit AcrB
MVAAIREQRHRSGRAVSRAVFSKVKPLSLSMISTCLGLFPFVVLGDQEIFWFALATGTLGGMVASAVYVFVVIPGFVIETK